MAFDTLSYARRLKQAGMPEAQAEAVAEATRDAITADAATKADIERLETATRAEFADVRHEIKNVRHEIAALRADLTHEIGNVRHEVTVLRTELKNDMAALEARTTAAMDSLGLRLTIRLGGFIAVGVAILAAIIKL
ncbi:MAG: coiled-coil domain-containing protein [Alphaproteobacteria bacterium]